MLLTVSHGSMIVSIFVVVDFREHGARRGVDWQ